MIEKIFTQSAIYIIYLNNIIGQGVDGTVYSSIYASNKNTFINNVKIATKIINKNIIEDIDNFIKIHKISSNYFGPCIYDIVTKEEKIYIFMELMDIGLNDWIVKSHLEQKSWKDIKNYIRNVVLPIHLKMKNKRITVGDKNVNNYMFKNNTLKRIDFTMSVAKEKLNYQEIKSYGYINVINPFTKKMEKILLT